MATKLLTAPAAATGETAFKTLLDLPGVTRAWPGKNGALSFEIRVENEGVTEKLQAGQISPRGEITLLPAGTDPQLPALATQISTRPQAQLVVHRWGKRAVLLDETTVIKITRPGKTPTPRQLREIPTAPVKSVRDAEGITEFVKLPGTTLHDLGDGAGAGWMQFIHQLEILPTLTETVATGPAYTAQAEQQHLETWLNHVENYRSLSAYADLTQLRQAVRKVQNKLGATAPKLVATHRDLHDKQVLWDGKTAYLLDLDTFSLGPAGLDLGNLAAHLELREIQRKISPEFKHFLLSQLAQLTDYELHPSYKAASQLRLASVYSFRPNSASWLAKWVENTLEMVENL